MRHGSARPSRGNSHVQRQSDAALSVRRRIAPNRTIEEPVIDHPGDVACFRLRVYSAECTPTVRVKFLRTVRTVRIVRVDDGRHPSFRQSASGLPDSSPLAVPRSQRESPSYGPPPRRHAGHLWGSQRWPRTAGVLGLPGRRARAAPHRAGRPSRIPRVGPRHPLCCTTE